MKNLNSGYVGRKQSKRADKAIKNGEVPLSMLTKRKLERHGVKHSVRFISWLCKHGHIRYSSRHHRGNPPILTRFYHPRDIRNQMENLEVPSLLSEWRETWPCNKRKNKWKNKKGERQA